MPPPDKRSRIIRAKLERAVALKVLPDAFARDPERLARFEREAQLLASLNHPNIAAIYGLEEQDGVRYLSSPVGTTEGLVPTRVFSRPAQRDSMVSLAFPGLSVLGYSQRPLRGLPLQKLSDIAPCGRPWSVGDDRRHLFLPGVQGAVDGAANKTVAHRV